ncbi:MAG: hypothetical protein WCI71_19435 [Bacteroidota bacterium]
MQGLFLFFLTQCWTRFSAQVLIRPGKLFAQVSGGMKSEVRITEKGPSDNHQVGLFLFKNGFGLCCLGD